ncbi:MAG: ABC transporter ATP-binding protein [Candidatus Eisenbacteria bacterium]
MRTALEVNGLSYRYSDGTAALDGLQFHVVESECVGLVGPNGAGKSTLLLHLNGVLPESPTRTSALSVFGQPIIEANLRSIRRQVGLLFQDPDDQLFCPTVYEDVAFGPKQLGLDPKEIVPRCSPKSDCSAFEARSPSRMSHGEKRRACLAGVLACDPSILVLDEPSADLDPRGRRELIALLRRLRSQRSCTRPRSRTRGRRLSAPGCSVHGRRPGSVADGATRRV